MDALLVRNGTAYPCRVLATANHGGFDEYSVRFTGKSKSVLYASGSHAWVLPSELHRVGSVKVSRNGVAIKDKISRLDFLESLRSV